MQRGALSPAILARNDAVATVTPCLWRTRSVQFSELDWVHEFNAILTWIDDLGSALLNWNALDVDALSSFLGSSFLSIIIADTSFEGFSALTEADVFDSHVNTLWDNPCVNALVYNDSDCLACDVENPASLSVIEFVGHTSMNCTVCDNVYVVSLLVVDQVFAESWHTMLSEWLGEQISRSSSETETVRHLSLKPSKYLI